MVWPIRFLVSMSPFLVRPNSYCISSAFSRSDSDHFVNRRYKYFSISNFSCFGGPLNGLNYLRDDFIGCDQFDLNLGKEIDFVFSPSVDLGMTSLPSKPFNLSDRHPLNTDFG